METGERLIVHHIQRSAVLDTMIVLDVSFVIFFTLKLCKVVIVKIIKFISSKLHNLRASKVLFNSLDLLGL